MSYHIVIAVIMLVQLYASTQSPVEDEEPFDLVPFWLDKTRVLETFPDDDFVRRRDPILQDALMDIAESDAENEDCTPLLLDDTYIETVPRGYIELGDLLERTYARTIFRVSNSTEFAIVYEHDCILDNGGWSTPVHPLVARAAYMKAAGSIAMSAKILFISPPAPFRETYKTSFKMSRDDFFQCELAEATVRYAIISLRIAYKWAHWVTMVKHVETRMIANPRQKYSQLFHFGARLVFMIKNLHSRNLLHGNLMPEVIAVTRQDGPGGKQLHFHLNSFFHTAYINPLTGASNQNQLGRISTHPQEIVWLSPWELHNGASHMITRKDEVFRIVDIIARSVSTTLDERYEMLKNQTLDQYKLYGKLFDMGFLLHVEEQNSKELISSHIARVEALIREGNILPLYDDIVYQLFKVSKILQGSTEWRFL